MEIGYVGKAFDRNDTVKLELNNKKMLEKYKALFDDYGYVKLKRMGIVFDHYETIDECDGRAILRPIGPQRNPDIFRWEFVADVGRKLPAPPLSGAIGPDAGEMAPNGDEGAEL